MPITSEAQSASLLLSRRLLLGFSRLSRSALRVAPGCVLVPPVEDRSDQKAIATISTTEGHSQHPVSLAVLPV